MEKALQIERKEAKTPMAGKNPHKLKTGTLMKRFLPYFKPYMGIMVIDLIFAALTTLCDLVLPLIVRFVTDKANTDIALLTISSIVKAGGLYLFLRLVDTAANYYMQSVGHMMGARMESDMRRDLFGHLQKLPHAYYDETKVGQIMSRITTDLNDVTEFAHHFPEEMFIAVIKIIGSFTILCGISVWLTVLVFVCVPVMVFCSQFFSNRMRSAFQDSRHFLGELNSQVEDSLLGIRVVKSFANEPIEEQKFAKGNERFLDIKKIMYTNMAGFHSVTRFFDGLMYIIVVVVGAIALTKQQISTADYVAYLLYITTLLASVRRIVEFSESFQRGITGIERFVEVLEEPVTIHDEPGCVEITDVQGNIEFENVTFGYGENLDDVLSHIDLSVKAGESIALVGPSGGGKTTMCNLIPRFYSLKEGSIKIDGRDIRDVSLKSLRNHIGMVQQDVYLFSGSVFENIAYGKPGATMDEVVEAAKLAGADEFIRGLDNGYDTFVGERGVKLSGGQKQRISIARVFLKNPPILILDEATSALDNESELLVQHSLEKLAKGRTTFTIAHRLTTIRNATRILVLTEKGIEESGTHEELMAKGGVYAGLYKLYSR